VRVRLARRTAGRVAEGGMGFRVYWTGRRRRGAGGRPG
jgi:hypothetical protein